MNRADRPSPIGAIEALLTGRIGLDPASVSPSLVMRAVRARMAALGIADITAYEHRIERSPAEQQELVEEVVIPESWFFRDDRPFGLLRELAGGRLVANSGRIPLRILSLACARGEEPLSIAMTLRDAGLDADRFHIDGVDISARNLDQARHGLYSPNSFRGGDLRFRDRYFRRSGTGYQIDPSILGAVRYLRANALDPTFLAGEPPYDVIFCRNLLIYLTPEARSRVVRSLDRLLAEDGVLIVGHADRLGPAAPSAPGATAFTPFGDPACFAFRKGGRASVPSRPLPEIVQDEEPFPFRDPVIARENIVPSPTPLLEADDSPAPSLLEQATELANRGEHDEAIRRVEKHLNAKGPSAAAYYLMGGIAQASGDRDRAEQCFQKAVYLDPHHDEALLALALSADRRGDAAAAAGYRRRAGRAATANKGVS